MWVDQRATRHTAFERLRNAAVRAPGGGRVPPLFLTFCGRGSLVSDYCEAETTRQCYSSSAHDGGAGSGDDSPPSAFPAAGDAHSSGAERSPAFAAMRSVATRCNEVAPVEEARAATCRWRPGWRRRRSLPSAWWRWRRAAVLAQFASPGGAGHRWAPAGRCWARCRSGVSATLCSRREMPPSSLLESPLVWLGA